jgi:hypothetical protein
MAALNQHDWTGMYSIKDMEEVHKFVIDGFIAALDVVTPVKEIVVKTGSNLYLSRETLEMMKRRDSAKAGTQRFWVLRKATNRLLKQDKLTSSAETLAKSSNDPRVLWQLANNALGKAPLSLPPAFINAAGSMTTGKREAAKSIKAYFINKVDTLRAAALADPTRDLAILASESIDMARDISHPSTETAKPQATRPTRQRTWLTWQGSLPSQSPRQKKISS